MQQDDISITGGSRQDLKTKKPNNGKWVSRQDAEMDNEASTPSTLASQTSSTANTGEAESHRPAAGLKEAGLKDVMDSARGAYDSVVSRGSDLLSKVDFSRGTGIIRDYPIQFVAGGLIVGFLVGAAVFYRKGHEI